MNKYKFIISAFLSTLACHALNAQSHGIIVGTTYGDFKTKIASMSDIKFNKQYSFNFLVGYGYNHSFNNRLELGSSLIYSQQKAVKTSGYGVVGDEDRKSTRLNSSHVRISYAVFCLKKKRK